jgi:methyl-accepting chemotaxis protein
MALIDWDDAFSVGIDEFDDEHKILIGLINRLGDVSDTRLPDEDLVGEVLSEMNGWAEKHFRKEEDFMQKIGYADFPAHKQAHDEFMARVHDLCVEFSCGNLGAVVQDLLGYLSHWLVNHILRADMAYRTAMERRASLLGRLTGGRLSTRHLSLRAVAYTAIGFLLLAVLFGFGRLSLQALDERTLALGERETTVVANLLLKAAGQWAVERGMTAAALNAAAPATADVVAVIRERRAAADAALDTARQALRTMPLAATHAPLARTEEAYGALVQARVLVDAALGQPLGQRDEALRKGWFGTITAAIERSQDLRQSAKTVDTHARTELMALDAAKHYVWVMSEFAGRERAMVGSTIASGRPFSTQQLSSLGAARGRVELGWDQLRQILTLHRGSFPAVDAAAQAVERDFFGTFQTLREQVHKAGSSDGTFPVTAADWIRQSTAAIDGILALSEAITGSALDKADQTAGESGVRLLVTAGVMSAMLILGILAFLTIRGRITTPLAELTQAMSRLAGGQLDVSVRTREDDEIGKLARMLIVFRQNAIHSYRTQDREKRELASREERRRRIENATARFDATIVAMLEKIRRAVEHLHASADSLSANAEETQRQSTAVSAATEQATANVETVSAASTELMASIQEISRQVQVSAGTARNAAAEATDTNRKIGGLVDAAQKIGEVVSLINNIASQTNLLALNATIEAARAGDAGKGFAVVAHEVKNLAGQTARATDDIGTQIAAVQTETRMAVQAIEGIGQTIANINELAVAIAGAVEEQGAATTEISRNVEQASTGTREVATNIAGVADAATETGRMAQSVFQAASGLLAESRTLEQEVQHFLREVRAA